MDAIRAATIRTLYVQARTSAAAAFVVTVYMAVASWDYSNHRAILLWLSAMALIQALRIGLIALFRYMAPPDDRLERWVLAYTLYMAVAGLLWGATAFLFMHKSEPLTIALTLCGLYGISGGSVSGNAYNPAGLNAFVLAIFGCVLVELLSQQQYVYSVLGFASAAFAAILILFGRVQAREIRESFRIRFENQALLEALTHEREVAETARSEAERASQAKSQFLAAASHDLRQPLHALSLLAGSLRSLSLADANRRIVMEMLANIRALEGLFNGLLDIARLDAGVVRVTRRPLSSDELFDRLNHLLRATSLERGIDLRFRSDGSAIDTDPVLIEQIMLNLAANAIHNTQQGAVLCAARRRGGQVRLEVWDTGRGIPQHEIDRIFDEFVQIGNDERDRRRGMGLGLAIARRSAGLLGTKIGVSSRVGKGSLFWFTQPLAEPDVQSLLPQPMPAHVAREPSDKLNVLLVEDDDAVRRALAMLFEDWGVPAMVTANAEAARDALAEARFSHILSDFRLPGEMDGLALLQHARESLDVPPALYLITGDMDADLISRAASADVALLHKPLSPDRLRELLLA